MDNLKRIREIWRVIGDDTYLPYLNRVDLAIMFNLLDFKKGAEIGVARGDYAYSLCKHNPHAQVYLIDPYRVYRGYNDITDHAQMKDNQHYAEKLLGCYTNVNFIYDTSMEALQRFGDETLDFVYIDGNHEFPYIAEDVYFWSKKIKSGGIVSGHDWLDGRKENVHVRQVIEAYTDAMNIEPLFILGDRSSAQNWMFVKP